MLSPLPDFPSAKPPSHPPHLLLLWGCSLIHLTHPLRPHRPGIPPRWSIKPPQDQGPGLSLMPDKAILCYICSWSYSSLHVYSLVGGLVPGSSGESGKLILLFFLQSFPNSSIRVLCSIQWLVASIHLCICQALAEPLRSQLYHAPVSKHFLASTIVSRFGDYMGWHIPMWDSLWIAFPSVSAP